MNTTETYIIAMRLNRSKITVYLNNMHIIITWTLGFESKLAEPLDCSGGTLVKNHWSRETKLKKSCPDITGYFCIGAINYFLQGNLHIKQFDK